MSTATIERVKPLKPIRRTTGARKRAPRHPIKPERRARAAVRKLFSDYHRRLISLLLELARRRKHTQLSGTDDPDDELKSAAAYGVFLFAHTEFMREIMGAAADTATSAKKQTARAIKRPVTTDLEEQESDFARWIREDAEERMRESIDRAGDIYDEWDELPEDDEDYEDEDALEERLDSGLDGITGAAIAYASMAFGNAFADMIKESQTDSGVTTYTWLSQLDSHVREAHAALDGEECSWDDPPLTAMESSIGEDCHPGEDVNCRCVASPDEPAEEGETEEN